MNDSDYLDAIRSALDGKELTPDVLPQIRDILAHSGRMPRPAGAVTSGLFHVNFKTTVTAVYDAEKNEVIRVIVDDEGLQFTGEVFPVEITGDPGDKLDVDTADRIYRQVDSELPWPAWSFGW